MTTASRSVLVIQDARSLADVFGVAISELHLRRHWEKRSHMAWILRGRGYPLSHIGPALGYADGTTVRYHLKRMDARIAAGEWPW